MALIFSWAKGNAVLVILHQFFNGSKPPQFSFMESEVIGVSSSRDTVHATIDPDKRQGDDITVRGTRICV
jgi:hypothetical protein